MFDAPQGFHLAQYKGFTSGLSVTSVHDSISSPALSELYSSRPAHCISCPNTSSEVDRRGEVAERNAKEEHNAKHRLSQTKLLTAFGLLEPASELRLGMNSKPMGKIVSQEESFRQLRNLYAKPSIFMIIFAGFHPGERKTHRRLEGARDRPTQISESSPMLSMLKEAMLEAVMKASFQGLADPDVRHEPTRAVAGPDRSLRGAYSLAEEARCTKAEIQKLNDEEYVVRNVL